MTNLIKLIIAILICQVTGILGSLFTASSISDWYRYLNKPFFSPPNWVFGPVWTLLYLLMGISIFLIWKKGLKKSENKNAAKMFGIQLVLNFFWSIIFFGLRAPTLAFIEILILWFFIFKTIRVFYKISSTASLLLVPYLVWVSFASILNLSIVLLN